MEEGAGSGDSVPGERRAHQGPVAGKRCKVYKGQNEAVQLEPRTRRTVVQGEVRETSGVLVPLKS